ncbi:PAS domain-containing protein [Candidatus Fermentibacteria bacterium]|nr:PAS domain-containing protein [Candidatus Fermentibacteria bacterium]
MRREAHLAAVLRAVRNVNQLIVREKDRRTLLNRACETLVETRGYLSAWIAETDANGHVLGTYMAGTGASFSILEERLLAGRWPACAGHAMAGRGVVVVGNPRDECGDCPLALDYDVSAALSAPLRHEDRNYGVLTVSLPCEMADIDEERDLVGEVATDLGLALHSLELEELHRIDEMRTAHLKQVLLAIRNVNQLIVHEEDPQRLIEQACVNLTETLGYGIAWIALLDSEGTEVTATASSGIAGLSSKLHATLTRGEIISCMKRAMEQDATIVISDPYAECPDCPLACAYDGRAGLTRRLVFGGRTYGVLSVSLPEEYIHDAEEQGLFCEVSGDLAFALYKIEIGERLRASEERLRLALQAGNGVVWDWDVADDTRRWNETGSDAFGWTECLAADQTAEWWKDRIHPEDRRRVIDKLFAAIDNAKADLWNDEYRFLNAGGSYIHVSDQGRILRDADGRAVRIIGVMADVTVRRRAEEEGQRIRDLLMMTEMLSGVGGWEWDVLMQRMTWTEGTYRIHDLDPESLPPGSPEHIERSLACYDKEDRELVADAFRRCVETGEPYDLECRLTTAAGRRLRVRTLGRAVRENGRIVRVIGNIQDITDIKRLEEEREKLQAQFLQAQKMESVGRLAGGVAHDFNNLLMGIMNCADLCRSAIAPDHPARRWLDEITAEVQRSAKLVHQLLAFARRQIVAPRAIDLNDAISGMLKLIRHLIGEDIELAWLPCRDAWPVNIDPGQVDQILANLCINARDAIGGVGRITIETENTVIDDTYCSAHQDSRPGQHVMLAVSDTGSGMDQETLDHIFEPFFTTKPVGQGTGLGLATVYGIVKQNSGFINVYSEPGQGTILRIYLPRHKGDAGKVEPRDVVAPPPHGSETVLLVEDENSVRLTTAEFLEQLGYRVLTAETPEEALNLAASNVCAIHLLITDVVMPVMSGRDLASRLAEAHPDLKCLFISGYTANVIAHRGILDEDVHFLAKPFNCSDLARKVRQVLDSP